MRLSKITRIQSLLIFLLAVSTFGLTIPQNGGLTAPVHRNTMSPRIVGGHVASSLLSFTVYIQIETPSDQSTTKICTGSLIDHNIILTAAHCFINERSKAIYSNMTLGVGIGRSSRNARKLTGYKVKSIILNQGYIRNSPQDDIALLILDKDVPQSVAQPVAIHSGEIKRGAKLFAAGWGVTSNNDKTLPQSLMEVEIYENNRITCSRAYPNWNPKTMVCAGGGKGRDTCLGDSGGPLVVNNELGEAELVGVTSFGGTTDRNAHDVLCGADGSVGFYTRVEYHLPWIRRNVDSVRFRDAAETEENGDMEGSGSRAAGPWLAIAIGLIAANLV